MSQVTVSISREGLKGLDELANETKSSREDIASALLTRALGDPRSASAKKKAAAQGAAEGKGGER